MKFSEQWLREWVNPPVDTASLSHQLTMAGLEVDEVAPVAAAFSGVIIAEVRAMTPHPDADKLKVCNVFDGRAQHQVVCGAPNVTLAMKVAFAMPGAQLPGGVSIKSTQLRGIDSHGMLCSTAELGINDVSQGLMKLPDDAPLGEDLRAFLRLDDQMFDINLTPNRSDCLSLKGLAREVSALYRMPMVTCAIAPVAAVIPEKPLIQIEAGAACPRYVGRIIRGVDLRRPTPLWMQEKLRRSGIRSLGPAVDVTNYVMLELGQPMHAFDLAQIDGGICVRMAHPEETLKLLDGQTITLLPDTLVIADRSKALAMAGIMGGDQSGVTDATKDLLLESAYFAPLAIAGRARRHGLHTESSHRFERGVDYQLQADAIERATRLLLDIAGGQPGALLDVCSTPDLPEETSVHLRSARIAQLLGAALDRTEIEEILTRLGLTVDKLLPDGWRIKVPSFRFDVSIEVDLIEEIGRVYGYDRLPVTEPFGSLTLRPTPESVRPLSRVADYLVSHGYQEVVTYSFIDPKLQSLLAPEDAAANESLFLANPIASDLAVMRKTLFAGLLKTLSYNQNRQQHRVRIFETGLSFCRDQGEIRQAPMLAGLVSGFRQPEGWASAKQAVDFYDAKGDLDALFNLLGIRVEYQASSHAALHPGQCAQLLRDGQPIGWLGALHPSVQKKLDLVGAVYLFELSLNQILEGYLPHFKEFSKFPEVRRDLAVMVDEQVDYAVVSRCIQTAAGAHLTGHRLFDVYQGDKQQSGLPASGEQKRKSLGISLFWQDAERTLNDDEIQADFDGIVKQLNQKLGATLRG